MLSELEKQVVLVLQRDLEITPEPFRELAAQLGVAEEELLSAIRSLMARGYIRRFGATLRHQKSGFAANALVAWKVPEADLRHLGRKVARYRTVTHCYARIPAPEFPYNLYTMLHGRTAEEITKLAGRISRDIGITDYEILFSSAELKKTTMRYFKEEG
jgi:DNA-binding Lrp family transcriptional regulator